MSPAGIRKNFFGFGDTVLFGEYGEHNDFASENFVRVNSSDVETMGHWRQPVHRRGCNGSVPDLQELLVRLQLRLGYQRSAQDFQAVIGGARVNF